MSIISCTSPRPSLSDLADLERHQAAERLLMIAEADGELAHHLAAPRRRPLAPLEKRLLRGARHLLVLVAGGAAHLGDRFAGGGVDRGERGPGGGDRRQGPGSGVRGFDAEPVEHGGGVESIAAVGAKGTLCSGQAGGSAALGSRSGEDIVRSPP